MATPPRAGEIVTDAMRLLARSAGSASLTGALHDLAHTGLGARVSVVLQPEPRGADYRVVSATGLDGSPLDSWITSAVAAEVAGRAVARDGPVALESLADQAPELAERLGSRAAIVSPLMTRDAPSGLLLLGFDADVALVDLTSVAALADAFVLALDRTRRYCQVEAAAGRVGR